VPPRDSGPLNTRSSLILVALSPIIGGNATRIGAGRSSVLGFGGSADHGDLEVDLVAVFIVLVVLTKTWPGGPLTAACALVLGSAFAVAIGEDSLMSPSKVTTRKPTAASVTDRAPDWFTNAPTGSGLPGLMSTVAWRVRCQ